MIELAWMWLRHQPDSALSRWFRTRAQAHRGRIRRIAIVALARKLLIALWRYVSQGEVPVGQGLAFGERQVLGGEHLQLQWDREPVLRPAGAESEEALARLKHGARGHGLEAIEIGPAIGIGLVGPGEPEALDLVLERSVLDQA
jgi:hypothetical protein